MRHLLCCRTAAVCVLACLLGLQAAVVTAADEPVGEAGSSSNEPAEAAEDEKDKPKGVLEKPVTIKGTDITLKFGGFAKVDFIQDFDPIGNENQFKVNSIPVEGDPDAELGGNTNISAKQTRFSLDVVGGTKAGDVHAYVEGDFFGDSNAFRLRHGYGEWRGLLGGQTWTTFQDISARPHTLDYEGPDSEIFVRQPMIRYTWKVSEALQWAIAAEDPGSQITNSSDLSGSGRNNFPDIPAHVRFSSKNAHIQLGGIVRQVRFVSSDGATKESTTGWGLNLSGKLGFLENDAFMGHVGFGSGIGRYIESFGGTNSDAVLTEDGELEALDAWAVTLGLEHHWNDKLKSTLSGGYAKVDNDPNQPGDAIQSATSGHLNLVYSPNRLLSLGGEMMWGERKNFDDASGEAWRFQFSIQYKFG